jgi:hypothetical protein
VCVASGEVDGDSVGLHLEQVISADGDGDRDGVTALDADRCVESVAVVERSLLSVDVTVFDSERVLVGLREGLTFVPVGVNTNERVCVDEKPCEGVNVFVPLVRALDSLIVDVPVPELVDVIFLDCVAVRAPTVKARHTKASASFVRPAPMNDDQHWRSNVSVSMLRCCVEQAGLCSLMRWYGSNKIVQFPRGAGLRRWLFLLRASKRKEEDDEDSTYPEGVLRSEKKECWHEFRFN